MGSDPPAGGVIFEGRRPHGAGTPPERHHHDHDHHAREAFEQYLDRGTIEYCGGNLRLNIHVDGVRVDVYRNVWFDRDCVDGSWTAIVMYPEDADERGKYHEDAPSGGIRVTNPVVITFIEQLMAMIAAPKSFGSMRDVA